MKTVADVMKKPITIRKDSTMFDAIKKMLDYNISRLVIQENQKPVGIITEKDIGLHLYLDKTAQSLEQIPVSDTMKKIIFTNASQTLKQCATILFENKIGSLVVGSENKLEGIITKTDIVNYFAEHYFGKHKIADLKNPGFVFTTNDAPLSHVIRKMFKNKISRIIVSDNKGKLTGIITFRDFFEILLQLGTDIDITESAALSGHVRKGFLSDEGFGGVSLARDIMTKKIVSVSPDHDLASACKIMINNQLNGLGVVDKEKKKIGVISKTDIIRFFSLL